MAVSRPLDQLRPVKLELDYVVYPEGSVLISMGNTRVLCNATVEENVPRWLHTTNIANKTKQGWVTAEYAMLPRATEQRNRRETLQPKGRTQEIQRLVARSLRGTVDMNKLGERQILVDCDVLQADGGTRTASITGGYVALALAIKRLEKRKTIDAGAVLKQAVAAVSVGILDGKAVLDLNYQMDQKADGGHECGDDCRRALRGSSGHGRGRTLQQGRTQRDAVAGGAWDSPAFRGSGECAGRGTDLSPDLQ